jgi:NAD(P)-dependent dehydrogenase (short-subunit alcohol dehydrogenase family)
MTQESTLHGALVTGASRGIGAAIARELARLGYGVCINYLASAGPAEHIADEIGRGGGRAFVFRADVRDFEAVQEMVNRTASAYGGLRAVVNNVGSSAHAALDDLSLATWDDAIATNLASAFSTAKAALPHLRREPWARIVSIASLRAMTGSDHGAHYAAAKSGSRSLSPSSSPQGSP